MVVEVEVGLLRKPNSKFELKAYKKRWWIITVFMYYSCLNNLQWIQYSSITPLVVKYYPVSSLAVDWTSTIFMAVFPILVIPASYFIDRKGVRLAAILGCSGTFIGTALKIFSIRPDLFWVVLLGNLIIASSSLCIKCLPSKLASLWFKPGEISIACSLGVFGSQLGTALGFVVPPFLVQDHENSEEIGANLKIMSWALAIIMVPVTIAVFIYFPDEPPLPPSNIQAILRENKSEFNTKVFFNSIKDLFLDKGFVIHFISYGLMISVFSAVGTLLSQFIQTYFEGATQEAGWMGFIMIVAGIISMFIFGFILDKTHKYKEIALFIYLSAAISVVILMFTLKYKLKIMTYIACILIGIFTNAYMMVGFEFCMELTFPAEESTTTNILLVGCEILASIFTVSLGYMNQCIGPFWSLFSQAVALFIGTVTTYYTPNNLRRQDAFKQNDPKYSIRKASYYGTRPMFIE